MTTSRNKNLSEAQLASVARLFAVLSEANRLTLLQALRDSPLSVSDLIKKCRMKQANVSKHLTVLLRPTLDKHVCFAIDSRFFHICKRKITARITEGNRFTNRLIVMCILLKEYTDCSIPTL